MSTLPVQTPIAALYTGISGTATSMRITPFPLDLDGNKLAMADFGTIGYCTIDPKISGYEEIVSFTGITDNGDNTATITGLTRDLQGKSPFTAGTGSKTHGSSAVVVFGLNPQMLNGYPTKAGNETITGQWTFSVFPITPATPLATVAAAGMTQMSIAPADPLHPIAVGANDTTIFAPLASAIPAGTTVAYEGITTPSGWLPCDGTAVSRATYATLFAALTKQATVTVTIASPAVFTSNGHGLALNMPVYFTTTGGLPSGLTAGTTYYVISAGLTANAFEVALTPGGAAVNTSGSQSGVHTFFYMPHGKGDASTTFNVPDRRGRALIGSGTGVKTATIASVAGNVFTANGISAAANNEFQTGQAVVFTAGVAGNLVNATTYYVVRTGNNTFSLATSLANAQAGTLITLAGTETGSFALTLTLRTLGDTGGEENHSQSTAEIAAHSHSTSTAGGSHTFTTGGGGVDATNGTSGSAGSNTPANLMQSFGVTNFIIKT